MTKTIEGTRGRKATIDKYPDGRFIYRVWDPKKGFIAVGFRKTEDEAIKAASLALNSK